MQLFRPVTDSVSGLVWVPYSTDILGDGTYRGLVLAVIEHGKHAL